MSQFEEYSPYMSDNTTNGGGMFTEAFYTNYTFGAFIIFILMLVGIYFLYTSPNEQAVSHKNNPQDDDDYLDIQIDLLNRQQQKNMS